MNFLKVLSVSTFLTASVFATAQNAENNERLLPKEGDVGATIVVNGLIDNINLSPSENQFNQNLLFGKYYLKDDLALRVGIGLNSFNAKREQSETVNEVTTEMDSTASQTTFNLSGGIEKHLTGTRRLDPFIFAQADFSFIGKPKFETETRVTTSVGTTTDKRVATSDGGIGVALNLGGGFNYFLAKSFSIGSEVYFSVQYAREGGTTSITDTQTDINGNTTSAFLDVDDSQSQTIIDVNPVANINISYFF